MASSTRPFPRPRKPQRDKVFEQMLDKFKNLSLPKLDGVYDELCEAFSKLDPCADQVAVEHEVEKDLCVTYIPERFGDIFPNEVPIKGSKTQLDEDMDTGNNDGPKLPEISVRSSVYLKKMELQAKINELNEEIAERSANYQRSKEEKQRKEKQKEKKRDKNRKRMVNGIKKTAKALKRTARDAALEQAIMNFKEEK